MQHSRTHHVISTPRYRVIRGVCAWKCRVASEKWQCQCYVCGLCHFTLWFVPISLCSIENSHWVPFFSMQTHKTHIIMCMCLKMPAVFNTGRTDECDGTENYCDGTEHYCDGTPATNNLRSFSFGCVFYARKAPTGPISRFILNCWDKQAKNLWQSLNYVKTHLRSHKQLTFIWNGQIGLKKTHNH